MMFVIWVIKDDYIDRKLVFEFGSMIIYWFLQGVCFYIFFVFLLFDDDIIIFLIELLLIVRLEQVKFLWGYIQYDFNDGQFNGLDYVLEIDQQFVFVIKFLGMLFICQQFFGCLFKCIVFVVVGVLLFMFVVFRYIKCRNN